MRQVELAPELVHELKKWKLACPKGELELIFPTDDGTPEKVANLLYGAPRVNPWFSWCWDGRFFPALWRARATKDKIS